MPLPAREGHRCPDAAVFTSQLTRARQIWPFWGAAFCRHFFPSGFAQSPEGRHLQFPFILLHPHPHADCGQVGDLSPVLFETRRWILRRPAITPSPSFLTISGEPVALNEIPLILVREGKTLSSPAQYCSGNREAGIIVCVNHCGY